MGLKLRFTPALVPLVSGLLMVAFTVYQVVSERNATIMQAGVQTENFARVLEEHARQTLNRVDANLAQANAGLGPLRRAGVLDVAQARQLLTKLLPTDRLIENVLLLDQNGVRVLSSGEGQESGYGSGVDSDYFVPHVRGADRELVFGSPVKAAGGQWLLPVSRRLGPAGGDFDGVVVAMVRTAYFQSFYDSIERGPDGLVTLFLSSGAAVVASPADDAVIRQNWSFSPMFREHLPAWPTGTVRQVVVRDGLERLYSYRALNDYPVVVTYGLSLSSVLSTWQHGVLQDGLLLAVLMLLLIGAAIKLRRQDLLRRHAVDALARSEEKFRHLIEWSRDAILVHRQGEILYVNPAAITLFGAENAQELLGKATSELIHPDAQAAQAERMKLLLGGAATLPLAESKFLRLDGKTIVVEVQGTSVVFEGAPAIHVSIHNITERKEAEDQIKNLAYFDPLTQLPNRRLLMDRLECSLLSSARDGVHGALLLLDLDNFKTLNDTLGHLVGDQLLVEVAARLTSCLREGDSAARLGGDEFVVILENLESGGMAALQAESVTQRILKRLSAPYQLDIVLADATPGKRSHHCTASIGLALFQDASISLIELLKRADTAMYQAKAAGRNTLRFFDAEIQAKVSAHAALEADLREAVQQQQFFLHYQPQVVGAGRITGVEALLRWQHPQRGVVSPAEFIPVAEDSGLILPIGQWVLETACAQLAVWAKSPALAHLTMAVNVSALQFRQGDFVDTVLSTLMRTRASPKLLKLELTESMLLDDVQVIVAKMSALKAKSVGFSLDDFGTGYSSLSYLKRLPLDQLKIDQGFIKNIVTDPNDAAIAKMVVALAESMGLSVIAEGVELQAQADFLAHLGCHAYQGYLFSRPLTLGAFETLMNDSELS
jgi:diguanylate cyclase (GGDEF)-like protein/PAS domain S-box-containing protein